MKMKNLIYSNPTHQATLADTKMQTAEQTAKKQQEQYAAKRGLDMRICDISSAGVPLGVGGELNGIKASFDTLPRCGVDMKFNSKLNPRWDKIKRLILWGKIFFP